MITPFIETYGRKKVEPGDKVVLIRTKIGPYYVITPGHILTYLGTEPGQNPGEMLKDEDTGIIVKHVSILDYQIYEPSLEKAKKLYIDKKEKQKFLKFVQAHCGKTFCERTIHMGCKLECIELVDEKKYKDNEFVKNYIRKLKLKEIQEEI